MKVIFVMALVLGTAVPRVVRADDLSAEELEFLQRATRFAVLNLTSRAVKLCLGRTATTQPLSDFGNGFYDNRDGGLIAHQLDLWDHEAASHRLPLIHFSVYYAEDFSYARAPLDVVRAGIGGFTGGFQIKINRYNLSRNRDVAVWGGVIAHEMLHNLSHIHPDPNRVGLKAAYSDDYVINAFQNCVSYQGNYRGSNIASTYRCGGR